MKFAKLIRTNFLYILIVSFFKNFLLDIKKKKTKYLQKKKKRKKKKSKKKQKKNYKNTKKKKTPQGKKKKNYSTKKKENIIISYTNFKFKNEFFKFKNKLYLLSPLSSFSSLSSSSSSSIIIISGAEEGGPASFSVFIRFRFPKKKLIKNFEFPTFNKKGFEF
jgi:hypothetical protein